jgi:hypothetical protein
VSRSALRRLQRGFARSITPRGTFPPGPALPLAALADRPRLAAAERLGVYRFAYLARLHEVLANDYPGVLRLVGGEAFAGLVRAYATRHPSGHPNLNQLGRRFPAFLARRRALSNRAAVVDVARLELALAIAFDADSQPPLDLAGLLALPAQRRQRARLDLQPSVQLLALAHDVSAWSDGTGRRPPRRVRAWLCVHRADWRVRRLALDVVQFRVLAALRKGRPLATALRGVGAAAPVADWFRQWAAAGLFAAAPRGTRRSPVAR